MTNNVASAPPRYQAQPPTIQNPHGENRVRLNPISILMDLPSPYTYEPLLAAPDIVVKDQNGHAAPLKEFLMGFIVNNRKLTPGTRSALIQNLDPNLSLSYPLLFPFVAGNNTLVVETIMGYQRMISYKDTTVNGIVRCMSIRRDHTDPELYYNFVMS